MDEKEIILKKEFVKRREGAAEIYFHVTDVDSTPSKSMNVFYNKKMEINRDVSNLAINAYNSLYSPEHLIIIDSMAASGISAIRMVKECNNIKKIYINDINPLAIDLIYRNIELNKIDKSIVEVSRKDANLLFNEIAQQSHNEHENKHLKPNVISIDPFGTPNLYVDNAFKTIQKKNGLICITATDTAVLFGVRKKACMRKYMTKTLHNNYCKEIGTRILVYYISRMANINKLGIFPLFALYSNHFIRVFALTIKNQKEISKNFENYGYIVHCSNCGNRLIYSRNILTISNKCAVCGDLSKMDYAGPLWVGNIHNERFITEIINLNKKFKYVNQKKIAKILNFVLNEINMPVSYYNIHKMCQKLNLQKVPKMEDILDLISKKGYNASRTHFDFTSIKTDMKTELLKKLLVEI